MALGTLLPKITTGMVFVLQGRTFRVTQIIPHADLLYVEPRGSTGRWAGFDVRASLRALQAALAESHPVLV